MKGTKSYNIHQIIKKFLAIVVLCLFVIIGASFWFISMLKDDIVDLKELKQEEMLVLQKDIIEIKKKKKLELQELRKKKSEEFKLLELKEKELIAQNSLYSIKIQNKISDIEELSSKLDDIEEIIGLKKDDEASMIQRLTLAQLTSEQKMFTLQTIPNGPPIKNIAITGKFGYRKHPVKKKREFHRGLDLKAKYNTKIYATADGVIKYVQKRNIGSFGRVIKIAHNFGFETVYAHLNKTKVKIGDIVKKGQYIGLTGSSGRSTGPHLHYEVSYASKALNPIDYIKWDLKNYEDIFKKQRRVQWESLVSLINNHQNKMARR